MAERRIHAPIKAGDKFGNQLVLGEAPRTGRDRKFMVRCECGHERPVFGHQLKAAPPEGCNQCREVPSVTRSKIAQSNTIHVGRKQPEYAVWCRMKTRCYNSANPKYPDYGGRGLRVCQRWRDDFAAFFQDMGPRPSPGHSLDWFPDNDGDYRPGNCRWATRAEQCRNRRVTFMVETASGSVPLADLTGGEGEDYDRAYRRIKRLGWSVERALKAPPLPAGGRAK